MPHGPLGSAHCPHACHAKAAETKGHRRDTEGRQGVHPTLGSALCPTPATQKRRRPRDTGGTPEDARAYIRPLGSANCPTPATQKRRRPRDTGGTPGRTSNPLAVHIVPRLPRKSGGDQGTPEGTPRATSDPLAVHIVPRLPRKSGGDQGTPRDARAYIRPLGSAHCPTPATQKLRRPSQGVHPTPWQ